MKRREVGGHKYGGVRRRTYEGVRWENIWRGQVGGHRRSVRRTCVLRIEVGGQIEELSGRRTQGGVRHGGVRINGLVRWEDILCKGLSQLPKLISDNN
jgi:hypothetical protein